MSDVKPMALSTAIRLGAMLKPQGFKRAIDHSGGSCALGAASDAVGGCIDGHGDTPEDYDKAARRWPVLWLEGVEYPERTGNEWGPTDVLHMVWALNDNCGWSRERIADWIEGIERSLEPPLPAAGEAGSCVSVSVVSDAQIQKAI